MVIQHYEIRYKKSFEKELRELPQTHREAVVKKILALAFDPRPVGSAKLRGSLDLYRFRHADYRVIYQINDSHLIIVVIKVGHRREIYREL